MVECREVRAVPRAVPAPPPVLASRPLPINHLAGQGAAKNCPLSSPGAEYFPFAYPQTGKECKNRSRRGCAVLRRLLAKSRVNESERFSLWREAVARA